MEDELRWPVDKRQGNATHTQTDREKGRGSGRRRECQEQMA